MHRGFQLGCGVFEVLEGERWMSKGKNMVSIGGREVITLILDTRPHHTTPTIRHAPDTRHIL